MLRNQILTLTLSVIALVFLTSCSPSKPNTSIDSASQSILPPQQALANCNNFSSADLNFNLATVIESTTGQVNMDWIKLKFNFLSADLTQSKFIIKFFKWRIINNSAQLDPKPLAFTTFSLSTANSNSETLYGLYTNQINKLIGFNVRLNDDTQSPYQVLKIVVYKSDGSIANQSDVLIPQFLANPNDYKFNLDGSPRAANLQKLHPLNLIDVANWTQTQFIQNFDKYCF